MPGSKSEGIVCDQFDIASTFEDSSLILSIATDLPDDTVLMISVSRSYFEEGSSTEYSHDYFSEKSTVGKWRSNHLIRLSNAKWKSSLEAHRKKMSRMGLGFNISNIANVIEVRAVVPINQPNPKFGNGNADLIGSRVENKGLRVVKGEVELEYPLGDDTLVKSRFHSLDPLSLQKGLTYVLEKKTPLMPTHSPKDPIEAIRNIKYIPVGACIKIMEMHKKDDTLWYQVIVVNKNKKFLGTGWVSSLALLGQKLEVL